MHYDLVGWWVGSVKGKRDMKCGSLALNPLGVR
jgi:hypothetical protein